jgi:hypothetical protein
VRVREQSTLRFAEVRLDSRRLRRTRSKSFTVRVPVPQLRAGVHRLRLRATDASGNQSRRTLTFRRCAR